MDRRNYLLIINSVFFILSVLFINFKQVLNDINHFYDGEVIPETSEVLSVEQNNEIYEDRVLRVIDGDTIELINGEKVRYIGIDSPERESGGECYYLQAKKKNENLVLGKTVRLVKDVSERDRYGRLLRYVYMDSIFVNEFMVKEGFAQASTYPPDVKFQTLFSGAEKYARENNLGLWGECN